MIIQPIKFNDDNIDYISSFNQYIDDNQKLNENIKVENTKLRITSFNVHSFSDYLNIKFNIEKFISIINEIDADILCLQEVIYPSIYIDKLKEIYTYELFCQSDYNTFGNCVLSKIKFNNHLIFDFNQPFYKLYKNKCAIGVNITYHNNEINIINVHLERDDINIQIRQLKNILSRIPIENSIILGDFNRENINDILKLNKIDFHNTFKYGKYFPYLTSLYHKVIDYILIPNCEKIIVCNDTYIYYTKISDHLPIISDFSINTKSNKLECYYNNYYKNRYPPVNSSYKYIVNKYSESIGIDIKFIKPDWDSFKNYSLASETIIINKITYNLNICNFHPNTLFYKGMENMDSILDNDMIDNSHAQNHAWYSNINIASYYVRNEKDSIYEYKLIRPIKLFILMDINNLTTLYDILIMKLKENIRIFMENKNINHIFERINLLQYNINLLSDFDLLKLTYEIIKLYPKLDFDSSINEIHLICKYIDIIKMTTGFNITWKEQHILICNYLNIDITIDRHNYPDDIFYDVETKNAIRFVMNNYFQDNYFSHIKEDLNRCSITKHADELLLDAILYVFNVDGYISYSVPSLFHRYYIFHNEIAVKESIGIFKLNSTDPVKYNPDYIQINYFNNL
jgi:endonuclease/exonuclease/phosphatase family metal-dependent hydrolase